MGIKIKEIKNNMLGYSSPTEIMEVLTRTLSNERVRGSRFWNEYDHSRFEKLVEGIDELHGIFEILGVEGRDVNNTSVMVGVAVVGVYDSDWQLQNNRMVSFKYYE